jgi:Phospholipase_D-nuclease N-terminal
MEFGLIGLIVLIFDIYAIVKILGSNATTGMKILWTLIILFLPVIGLVLWLIMGPK